MTIYTLIQQEEVQKVTKKTRIRPQNKPNEKCTQKFKCQGLCHNNKGIWGIELMVRWIDQGRINCGIKFKIYGTIFSHPKERWITIIGIELQEIEPTHNKE